MKEETTRKPTREEWAASEAFSFALNPIKSLRDVLTGGDEVDPVRVGNVLDSLLRQAEAQFEEVLEEELEERTETPQPSKEVEGKVRKLLTKAWEEAAKVYDADAREKAGSAGQPVREDSDESDEEHLLGLAGEVLRMGDDLEKGALVLSVKTIHKITARRLAKDGRL